MASDTEILYRRIGRLIEEMPNLTQTPLSADVHLWLGRAYALVKEVNNGLDPISFSMAAANVGTSIRAATEIKTIIYRAFALTELEAPAGVSGAFIPVGDSFDAYSALSKVLQTATKDVLIIDPYMDESVLVEFGSAVPENTCIRLIADEFYFKDSLRPAAEKWVQQYRETRPLLVRLAPRKTLHDRAILIDQTSAWTLTQSFKDFAKRSPAEIVRADDTAALKIDAYEKIWASAQVII